MIKRGIVKFVAYIMLMIIMFVRPCYLKAAIVPEVSAVELKVNEVYSSKSQIVNKDKWFFFTPPQSGSYKIKIDTTVSAYITLYDKVADKLLTEAEGMNGCEVANTLIEGKTYYIKVNLPKSKQIHESYTIYIEKTGTPNDPYFERQWGLYNVFNGIDINVLPAWEYSQGEGIKIGVIDTGTDYSHVDLKQNTGINLGYNFVHAIKDVFPQNEIHNSFAAKVGHGTMVTGIIGAEVNNKEGICGIAPKAEVIPLKILGEVIPEHSTYDDSVKPFIHAVEYAKGQGVKIINCSFGGSAPDDEERKAMEEAKEILFIIAAGNKGNDLGEVPNYPASYYLDNAIVVGAVDYEGQIIEMSSYGGPTEIVAPGLDILSTYPNNQYFEAVGTSMATPFVTGTSALVWASNPNISATEVKQIILDNVTPLEDLKDKVTSGGMINAYKAVSMGNKDKS